MAGSSDYVTFQKLDAEIQNLLKRIRAVNVPSLALDDLTDVNAPSPSNTNVLAWNESAGEWQPAPAGGSLALDDLTDVNAPSPSDADVLTYDEGTGTWIPAPVAAEDSPADRVIVEVTQTSHGLAVGDVIKVTAANTYAKAQADSATNAEVVGVVATVDGDDFTYVALGVYDYAAGVPAGTVGQVLFLSPSTAGLLTTTEPSVDGQVSKPVAVILESDSKMLIFSFRGVVLGASGESGADNFLDLTDTPNTYNGSQYGLVRVNDAEDALEFSLPHESMASTPFIAEWPPPTWTDAELDGQGVNSFVGPWAAITTTGIEVDTLDSEKVIAMAYADGEQRASRLGLFDPVWYIFDGSFSFEFKTNISDTSAAYINIALAHDAPWAMAIGGYSGGIRIGLFTWTALPTWPGGGYGTWENCYYDIDVDAGAAWHLVRLSLRYPYIHLFVDDEAVVNDPQIIYIPATGGIEQADAYINCLEIFSLMVNGGSGEYFRIKNVTLHNNDLMWPVGKEMPAYVA